MNDIFFFILSWNNGFICNRKCIKEYFFWYASISKSYSLLCNDTLVNNWNSCIQIRVMISCIPICVLFLCIPICEQFSLSLSFSLSLYLSLSLSLFSLCVSYFLHFSVSISHFLYLSHFLSPSFSLAYLMDVFVLVFMLINPSNNIFHMKGRLNKIYFLCQFTIGERPKKKNIEPLDFTQKSIFLRLWREKAFTKEKKGVNVNNKVLFCFITILWPKIPKFNK